MNSNKIWMHGTQIHFDAWKLPLEKQPHKGDMAPHSAIFFTTSKEYALGAANGSGGLCTAKLKEGVKILNMNNCTDLQSEQYRIQCSKQKLGAKSLQIISPQHWMQGWKSGNIMKYSASSEAESVVMQRKANLAINAKHTLKGAVAHNELQLLTRNVIEELVVSAKELGYDAVVGNEIDTLHPTGPKTFEIMFIINHHILSEPSWLSVPR